MLVDQTKKDGLVAQKYAMCFGRPCRPYLYALWCAPRDNAILDHIPFVASSWFRFAMPPYPSPEQSIPVQ